MNFESKHTVARWGHGGSDGHALPERNCRHHWPSHVAPSCLGVTWPFRITDWIAVRVGRLCSLYLQEFIHAPAFACCANLLNAMYIYIYYINCHYFSFVHHVMCRKFNCYLFMLCVYVPLHLFMHSYSVIPEAMVLLFCLLCMIHSLICLLVSTSLRVSLYICSGHCCVVHKFVLLTWFACLSILPIRRWNNRSTPRKQEYLELLLGGDDLHNP